MIKGFATPEGTAAYKSRFTHLAEGHFRQRQGLWFSSIGCGSYLGELDKETDRGYEASLKEALLCGINVVDTAINYRAQRSERAFGRALTELVQDGKVKREEVIICTKGGFIPYDGEYPEDPAAYLQEAFLNPGLLKPHDIVAGCHAMTPAYIENQIEQSLRNLNLETIDIYYLHNPETQLSEIDRTDFHRRLREVFELLEMKVKQGVIRMYGTATWTGYRVGHDAKDFLDLEDILIAAREDVGAHHHFQALQLPYNLAMPEAWILPNQHYGGHHLPLFQLAEKSKMVVVGSASLLQARLIHHFPEFLNSYFPGLLKPSQRSLQFARSGPGLTTALVGMKTKAHVLENIETAKVPLLKEEDLVLMFQKKER
ncbi:MAG: aldo/keto reductase [Candidatus Omnitrophica bacterium]|nr:aldo/keto reductase [Candidatus Omnitrophota bacterium]